MKLDLIPAKPRSYRIIIPICQIVLIWLVIIAGAFGRFDSNEVDALPSAKQFVQHSWLPNDWYLNLDIGYRQPFDAFFGVIVSRMGFQYGAYLGRLLIYLLLAVAMYVSWRAFGLRFSVGLVALLLFVHNQSLVAGEWIAGGVEAKAIAYAFAILSCSFFFGKRYLAGFACAGAAISFHTLVGIYGMFCTMVALMFTGVWRSEWPTLTRRAWPFLMTGAWGLQTVARQLLSQGNANAMDAWRIYVGYRVPHHLLPAVWRGYYWVVGLASATCLFSVIYSLRRSRASRFISAYALGSIFLFTVGLAVYKSGKVTLLRFYWFRFPDVMIPLLSFTVGAAILYHLIASNLLPRLVPRERWHHALSKLRRGMPAGITLAVALIALGSAYRLHTEVKIPEATRTETQTMLAWIAENTPKQSVFLVAPTIADFYIYAQRAMFVSFKHSPQSAPDILEWYRRIVMCNGERDPKKRGFDSQEELQTNFYKLSEESIQRVADSYGIRYYLGRPEQLLAFRHVHSTPHYTLYEIQ